MTGTAFVRTAGIGGISIWTRGLCAGDGRNRDDPLPASSILISDAP